MTDRDHQDAQNISNESTSEGEDEETSRSTKDREADEKNDALLQNSIPLELSSTLEEILIDGNKDGENDVSESVSHEHSLEVDDSSSSDSKVYKFYKTNRKNENVPKAKAFIYMTIPPDGGYAWLILGIAFLCQAIVDGILFSIGILLPHIASELSLSYKQAALVASTQIAPLGSAFINKFGFRPVAITGSLISSISIFVASFSQNTLMLVVFYGIIAGPAMGLIWMSTALIVNYYFQRFRAIVGGIASSGSGIGIICVSLLNIEIVEKYGWRIAARIHVILLLVAGLLVCSYREVKPIKIGQYLGSIADEDSDDGTVCSDELACDRYSLYITPELLKGTTSMVSSRRTIEHRMNYITSERPRTLIQKCCPCFVKKLIPNISEGKRLVISHSPFDRHDIFYDGPPDYSQTNANGEGDFGNVDVFEESEGKNRTVNYTLSVIRRPSQGLEDEKFIWIPAKIKSAFYALFDLQLLNVAEFRLLLLESFLFPMGFNIPFVYSSERAQINEDYANSLPVIIGLTNVIFRISMGFVAFQIKVHTAYLSGSGMIVGGFVTLLSGFVGQSSEVFQFFFAFCFAFGAASYSALRAIVYVKVLGLEKLTNAFGLTTMVMGVGVFIGTNFAGFLNDFFASYWASFAFSGTCMTLAGLLKLSIPKYVKHRREINANKVQRKVHFAKNSIKKTWWQKCFC